MSKQIKPIKCGDIIHGRMYLAGLRLKPSAASLANIVTIDKAEEPGFQRGHCKIWRIGATCTTAAVTQVSPKLSKLNQVAVTLNSATNDYEFIHDGMPTLYEMPENFLIDLVEFSVAKLKALESNVEALKSEVNIIQQLELNSRNKT